MKDQVNPKMVRLQGLAIIILAVVALMQVVTIRGLRNDLVEVSKDNVQIMKAYKWLRDEVIAKEYKK